jgi:hypothetical protein
MTKIIQNSDWKILKGRKRIYGKPRCRIVLSQNEPQKNKIHLARDRVEGRKLFERSYEP